MLEDNAEKDPQVPLTIEDVVSVPDPEALLFPRGMCREWRCSAGAQFVSDHTNAATHPIIVHPKRKFSANMAVVFRCLRDAATIHGTKYSTTPRNTTTRTPITSICRV